MTESAGTWTCDRSSSPDSAVADRRTVSACLRMVGACSSRSKSSLSTMLCQDLEAIALTCLSVSKVVHAHAPM